jgi:very-short-patch-repair endonuclease
VKKYHNLQKEQYESLYGKTICENSIKAYKNTKNYDWITRAKQAGKDLADYKKKMSKSVSEAILSNPKERIRRAELLGSLNKTVEFRKKSSETAKKTSARPEILEHRSQNLAKWQKENFEEFYDKCTSKMINCWQSIPEKALFQILRSVEGYEFKRSQRLKSESFISKSKVKLVDAGDKKMRVYVEFDGPLHFEKKFELQTLEETQLKDRLLDEHIEKHCWTLIRISHDQFSYNKGGSFKEECIRRLFEALKNPQPGVLKIGEAYKKKEP